MAKRKVAFDEDSPFAGLNSMFESKNLIPLKSSSDDTMVGIPVPSLAVQYMLGTSALPLSRSFQLIGSEGSYKSTFMYEMMRWYIDSGGLAVLVETEAKDSGYIRNGVMQWDPNRIRKIAVQSTNSYQQWMSSITHIYSYYKKTMQDTGTYHPLILCVDSITAAASEETLEKIEKEGCAQPGYPDLAKNLSADFKSFPDKLNGFPYSFLFINHVKPGTDSGPYSRGVTPGGKALSYYNSLTIKLSSGRETESADGSVRTTLIFTTWKNSNGKEGRQIDVDLVRWSEEDPEDPDEHIDYVLFDWNTTDIKFLLKLQDSTKIGADLRRSIKDLLGLHAAKVGAKNGVYSEPLGIPKEEPVTFAEAGKALHENKELMKKVRNILLIRTIPDYTSEVDYKKLIESTATGNRERIQRLARAIAPPDEVAEQEE